MDFPAAPGQAVETLLVDDNPGDARLIEEAFKDARIANTPSVVTTGRDALDYLHHRGEFADEPYPDLLLLDWRLPQLTGERILEEIRPTTTRTTFQS